MAETKTHTIKTNPEESVVEIKSVTLGSIIGDHLPIIMNDRKYMTSLEQSVDNWVKTQKEAGLNTAEEKTKILTQLKTALGCLESIYSRVAQTL